MESRLAAAGQLQEMSRILVGTMERIYSTREDTGLELEIGKRLRLMGVQVHKVFFYNPQGRKRQVYVTMNTRRKICVPSKKIAAALTELMECEMMPARDSRSFVSQERVTILFVEGVAYNVLYGVKKETGRMKRCPEITSRYSGCRRDSFMPDCRMGWDRGCRHVRRAIWCWIFWNSFWKRAFPGRRQYA